MKLAVTFTVNNRPEFFRPVLDSWLAVRDKEDVMFNFSIEPSPHSEENDEMATAFIKEAGVIGRVYNNSEKFGCEHNPYIAFQRAFGRFDINYTILAEDDLLVSNDILEYHKWAYMTAPLDVGVVCSFTKDVPMGRCLEDVRVVPNFASCWIWGTWRHYWEEVFAPTWDHDYSTGVGVETGWDWNMNLRVMPEYGLNSLQPDISRVQNIGAYGEHAAEGMWYEQALGFNPEIGVTDYALVG